MDLKGSKGDECACSNCYWADGCLDTNEDCCEYYMRVDIDIFFEEELEAGRRELFDEEWLEYAYEYADRSVDE